MSLPLTIRRLPDVSTESDPRTLRGTFAGVVSSAKMHRSAIEQLVPKGSGLTPIEETADGQYQVSFLFGQQRQVRNVWGKWEFQYGFGIEYEEVLLVIPHLKLPSSGNCPAVPEVTLYARIFLNSLCSSILGRFMYGFSKHHGRFENEPHSFTAFNRHDHQIFQAEITPSTGEISAADVDRVRELFSYPVALARKSKKPNECPLSIRQFHYDISPDSIEPVETTVSVDHQFTKKSPSMTFSNVGLDRDAAGSFCCEFPWVMTEYHPADEPMVAS